MNIHTYQQISKRIKKHLKEIFVFLLILIWVFIGYPQIWQKITQLFSTRQIEAAGFDTGYEYRKPITVQAGQVAGGPHANFPMLISRVLDLDLVLDPDGCTVGTPPISGPCSASGYDIIFTDSDGTTQLAHEIEEYTTGGTLVAWVKIPSISDGKVIYMYYGKNGVTTFQGNDATGCTANPTTDPGACVWDTNYRGVWHLEESPADGVAGHDDSVVSGNNGTPQSFADGGGGSTNAVGKISGADNFSPTGPTFNDRVHFGSPAVLDNLGPLTYSAWINSPAAPTTNLVLMAKADTNSNTTFGNRFMIGSSNQLIFQVKYSTTNVFERTNVGVSLGTWQHVAVTWDGSDFATGIAPAGVHIYINGVEDPSPFLEQNGNIGGRQLDDAQNFAGGANADGSQAFSGLIDEIKVSAVVRTPDYLLTEFRNQNNQGAFYTMGGEQQQGTGPTDPALADTPAFPNKATDDTTPDLGSFSSTDPQSDLIEYEIQWSTDSNFVTGVTTKNSANFAAADNGFTQATFTSGASVTYTPTGIGDDILAAINTYWWRVRARDPLGANLWSNYSLKRSISIDAVFTSPQWFETTDAQFNDDTSLTDVETTGSGPTAGVKLKGW